MRHTIRAKKQVCQFGTRNSFFYGYYRRKGLVRPGKSATIYSCFGLSCCARASESQHSWLDGGTAKTACRLRGKEDIVMKKRPRSGLMFITALIFLMFMTSERAPAVLLTLIVDGTIRDGLHSPKDGVPDSVSENTVIQVLDVDRDRLPFEDRGIIEFTVSRLSQPIANAELVLIVRGTTGPFPFTIDLFTYTGDGSLSLDDFNAGSLFGGGPV